MRLADPEFHKPREVDALLGNKLFYSLLLVGQIKLCSAEVILQNTQLGWIVTGSTNWQRGFAHSKISRSFCIVSSLERSINKFLEVEELPERRFLSEEESDRDSTDRYVVRLPFNQHKNSIGDSRTAALQRFYSLERRLQQNSELFERYRQCLNEYLASGHMQEIRQEQGRKGFYLPHHAVVKEASATTKIRVVFDASAKSSTNISLNDTLLTGPTIQDTL